MLNHRFSARVSVLVACLMGGLVSPGAERSFSLVSFESPSVERRIALTIIVPEGYEDSQRRYPVLYLLHGRGGDENSWLDMGATQYAAQYEMIVVMPSMTPSWYVNWTQSRAGQKNDWADCVTRDLIGYVDSHYRTVASREGRAISGMSMGGYGALTLGFLNPDLFCSVSSIAGGLRFIDKLRDHLRGQGPDPLYPDKVRESKREMYERTPLGRMVTTLEECDAIDPFKLVLKVPRDRLPDIRIDCGVRDNLLEYSQRFARLLMEHKITFTFGQAPGGHNADYGARVLGDTMAHQYGAMMKQLEGRDLFPLK